MHSTQNNSFTIYSTQTSARKTSELLRVFAVHVQIPQRRVRTEREVHPLVQIAPAADEGRRVAGVQGGGVQMPNRDVVRLVARQLSSKSSVGDVVTDDLSRCAFGR